MVRRLVAVTAVFIGALLFLPGVAQAAPSPTPYPPSNCQLTVSASTVTVGNTVTVTGHCFGKNVNVVITVTYAPPSHALGVAGGGGRYSAIYRVATPMATVATVTTDANGNFSAPVTLNQVGTATITASGPGANAAPQSQSATVNVLAASSSGGSSLPRTGADGVGTQLWVGAGLLALGAGLVALTVSRRRIGSNA